MHQHLPAGIAQRVYFQPLLLGNPGHFVVFNRDKQVLLMQHLVVLEVMQQRVWHADLVGVHKHRHACYALRWVGKNRSQKLFKLQTLGYQPCSQQGAATVPSHHQQENQPRYSQREPAAVHEFHHIREPECAINHQEKRDGNYHQRQRPLPDIAQHKISHQRGNDHIGRHGNAVSARQVSR